VLYELETGIAKSNAPEKRLKQLEEIVSVVRLLPFGRDEAKIAAAVRAQLDQQGTPIGPYDLLIAGTALSYDGVLVTRNSSEFARVENLRLEDWYG
ncbi:MAG: PIN domain-containing protein, partial [Gammaproteobacteria bacterium]|nr:PIN domain-containing protein [Gammaproteobacteria bacterium]